MMQLIQLMKDRESWVYVYTKLSIESSNDNSSVYKMDKHDPDYCGDQTKINNDSRYKMNIDPRGQQNIN